MSNAREHSRHSRNANRELAAMDVQCRKDGANSPIDSFRRQDYAGCAFTASPNKWTSCMNEDEFLIVGQEEDEVAELLADLDVFRACVKRGHFPAPLNGWYVTPNDDGLFSVTLYDYSNGTDFATPEQAKEQILRMIASERNFAAVQGLPSYRGYVIGFDPFQRDLFSTYARSDIRVGGELKSVKDAIESIKRFIGRTRRDWALKSDDPQER